MLLVDVCSVHIEMAEPEVLTVLERSVRHSVRNFVDPLPPDKREAVKQTLAEAVALPHP
jgi:hypothetical protein